MSDFSAMTKMKDFDFSTEVSMTDTESNASTTARKRTAAPRENPLEVVINLQKAQAHSFEPLTKKNSKEKRTRFLTE